MRPSAYITSLALVALLLSACSGSPDADETTLPPSPTTAPTASPSPSDVVDATDPATWLVSDAGIGPIALGMPFADAVTVLPSAPQRDLENCAHVADWLPADVVGTEFLFARPAGGDDQAPVEAVSWNVWDAVDAAARPSGPRTDLQIGIGSTVEEVRSAYPDAVEITRNGDYLQAGGIYFGTREGVVSELGVTAADVPWEYCG